MLKLHIFFLFYYILSSQHILSTIQLWVHLGIQFLLLASIITAFYTILTCINMITSGELYRCLEGGIFNNKIYNSKK